MNKILWTLLSGIGIGKLIAPAKGSETWQKMVDCVDEYKDKLADEAGRILKKGKENVGEAENKVEEVTRNGQ